MRLLYLIPALFFLFHVCVLGKDNIWTFNEEVPGWNDLRKCVRNCISKCDDSGTCSCRVAERVGCETRSCLCDSSVRDEADKFITTCVKNNCKTTDEPGEAVTIFNNFCDGVYPPSVSTSSGVTGPTSSPLSDGVYPSSVSVDSDATGPTRSPVVSTALETPYSSVVSPDPDTTGPTSPPVSESNAKTVIQTGVTEEPSDSETGTQTDEPVVATQTQTVHLPNTAQRGVASLWDTLTGLMVSLVAMSVWGWVAV